MYTSHRRRVAPRRDRGIPQQIPQLVILIESNVDATKVNLAIGKIDVIAIIKQSKI